MKKTLLLLCCVLSLCMSQVWAQGSLISGKIIDEKGETVIGATIRIEGTNKGAVSDVNGNFKIAADAGTMLTITAIGMKRTDKAAQNGMIVKMQADPKSLRETVVTAFGIKKEKRALSYANTTVKNEQITQGQNQNALNALSGKVAGLQITNSSGTPGAASFIQLRGATTFTGNNQPLIVVDGSPIAISGSSFGDPDEGDNAFLSNISGGSRAFDINPEDIENISVIKGPAGAALYGSAGANGVILITTKKGAGKKGLGVTYNTTLTWDRVNKLPELQNRFLQGRGGRLNIPKNEFNTSHARESWGPAADTMYWNGQDYLWDVNGYLVGESDPSKQTKFRPYDNTGSFFQTAKTWNNNVTITNVTDRSSLKLNLANMKQEGIVPNSEINRTNIGINAESSPKEGLVVGTSVNYANTAGTYVQQGSNLSGIMLGLLRTPINFDNLNGTGNPRSKGAYQFDNGLQRTYRGYGIYDNPYYTINQNQYKDRTNRLYGNVFGTITPLSWLSITNRLGTDYYNTGSQQNFGKQSSTMAGVAEGRVAVRDENYQMINNDLIATITPFVGEDYNLEFMLGHNLYSENYVENYTRGDNLVVEEWYNINNAKNIYATQAANYKFRRSSQFGQAKFGYKNYFFADVTGRLEQATSYMPQGKGMNFYPSMNTSFIFSDAFKWTNSEFNFGKIRMSWAQAGKNPPVQSTLVRYTKTAVADGWTSGQTSPINDQVIFESSRLYDRFIRPEITRSFEIGTELRFFSNRLGIDYTFYDNRSKDLHAKVPVPATSGYSEFFTNAGVMRNRGHEVMITATPIKKKDFRWDIMLNYTRNRNTVEKIADGVETIVLNGFEGSQVVVRNGEAYGQFYGTGYLRDASGRVVIEDDVNSPGYGYPILDPTQKSLGNVMPRWLGGLNNIISYKGLSLNFLFETRQGGVIWNGTRGALASFGTAKETEGRDVDTKVFEGVYGHVGDDGKIYHYDGNGNPVAGTGGVNNSSVKLNESYYRLGMGSGFAINEPYMESASWVRLREVGLSYSLPTKWMSSTRVFKGLTLGFVGRNLLLWTKYKGVDPETSLIGGGNAQGLDYFNNPGTKTWGINLKANF